MILPPPTYSDFVLPDLLAWRRAGHKTALLTLISTTGASPRPIGSQLAVCETGEACGLITGGCAEATLVLDALAAIEAGENRCELYGEGSRFKDITLPCGSGLLVWFDVTTADTRIEAIIAAHAARQPADLVIARPDGPIFTRRYLPQCRLHVVGQGPIVSALAGLAPALEIEMVVWTPDKALASGLSPAITCHALPDPGIFDAAALDRHSALVLVFHDHGFEPDILLAGLATDAFYIGALGSHRAAARRRQTLVAMGAAADAVARIHGPVGLDIGAASPPEIALSILAAIIAGWRRDVVT